MELTQCLKSHAAEQGSKAARQAQLGSIAAASGTTQPLPCVALTCQLQKASSSALAKT